VPHMCVTGQKKPMLETKRTVAKLCQTSPLNYNTLQLMRFMLTSLMYR